ncbi:NAD(P)/FAD-dependent oxidoreductase [Gammaproteobacteria bacterium]|nr:NAD(P)/FAD-dependent oxidoreductase [Gammaproteobacteria bacterium]
MNIPGYSLKIPNSYTVLNDRLCKLLPKYHKQIYSFLKTIKTLGKIINNFSKPSTGLNITYCLKSLKKIKLLQYYGKTLQDVFDYFKLPIEAQGLLASQWPDFLLPPDQLSFFAWLVLFDGYMGGAYYPKNHFEHVINSLIKIIKENNGTVIFNEKVVSFKILNKKIESISTVSTVDCSKKNTYSAKKIICNIDPQTVTKMIGYENFSSKIIKKISYDYSYSNFVAYAAVENLDLRNYGFGNWNIFHSDHVDINTSFNEMYYKNNYRKPSFAITTPSLVTKDTTGCPDNHQIIQLLTVANYSHFNDLKLRNQKTYIQRKKEIFNCILDSIEKNYIPDIRKNISFKMLGSPTTNKSYCLAPEGNSYGSNMTPKNINLQRLNHETSIKNFYFCNASSGFAGFTKCFQNGAALYEKLSGDIVPTYV